MPRPPLSVAGVERAILELRCYELQRIAACASRAVLIQSEPLGMQLARLLGYEGPEDRETAKDWLSELSR